MANPTQVTCPHAVFFTPGFYTMKFTINIFHHFLGSLLIMLTLLFVSAPAQAQGNPNDNGPVPDASNSPTGVPIDGGASLLLAAGGALALRRLRRSNQS